MSGRDALRIPVAFPLGLSAGYVGPVRKKVGQSSCRIIGPSWLLKYVVAPKRINSGKIGKDRLTLREWALYIEYDFNLGEVCPVSPVSPLADEAKIKTPVEHGNERDGRPLVINNRDLQISRGQPTTPFTSGSTSVVCLATAWVVFGSSRKMKWTRGSRLAARPPACGQNRRERF